jgi:hypothetical protein
MVKGLGFRTAPGLGRVSDLGFTFGVSGSGYEDMKMS